MECLFVFYVVVALLVVGAVTVIRNGPATSKRRRSYDQVSKRFRGRYQPGGLVRRPAVLMVYGATRAALREAQLLGPYRGVGTQMQIGFPDRKVRCELFPRSDEESAPVPSRMREVEVGNQSFDREFLLRLAERRDDFGLFSDGVCWQVSRLAKLSESGRLYVRLYRGQLIIQTPELLRDFSDLEPFVEASLDLYDQLMLTRADGIEFPTEDADLPALDDVTCTICGDQIINDWVYCRRCKTPHHGECWDYTGSCAMFGCGETRCLRPQAGEAVDPDA